MVLDRRVVRLVPIGGVRVFDDQHARVGAVGLPQRQIRTGYLTAGKPEGACRHQPAKDTNELGQCVS